MIFNYKNTINNINTNDNRVYGTVLISCSCASSKYLNDHHAHNISGDLWIIKSKNFVSL